MLVRSLSWQLIIMWCVSSGIYRQAYSYITEVKQRGRGRGQGQQQPLIWWGPHASVTTAYRPVAVACDAVPVSLSTGWYKTLDRGSGAHIVT